MAVLVTGGAGYIGSHTVAALLERGEDIVVVDSLQQGHRSAVLGGKLYVGDLRDADFLEGVFAENDIDAVIHFAANSLVGESMKDPGKYYHNNVYGTLCLLEAMNRHQVGKIVFSSTAATYGEPENVPIGEHDRTLPTNAYGETKLAMEKMMKWFDIAHGIKYISLRYFNAAGAHESGRIGEDHQPETHLIPIVLQAALGQRPHISVFGEDYDTPDGTCIRDYIHVSDLAEAHVLAVGRLRGGAESAVYNLGNGQGFSVKQVIDIAREVTGRDIPSVVEPRRSGDPAVLVASSERARTELGWNPTRNKLEDIILSAWKWHSSNPQGYDD
ncbi:UDP-glucose 4-epimerase GalE [Paenibacillus beijingensis]|uniref:UDP-glucose 4-epimerase n=1 Tax=Paenibacillus beijingensis TaxID=1126833 RepID=A0A0D5NKB3_9BACL|nr:UDP-glucose 4-epimerase GalE [Paenibacillus beijingensis]AJY75671.1 UDP-glucose 4-epimerase [Paenibacillus beijingensis]